MGYQSETYEDKTTLDDAESNRSDADARYGTTLNRSSGSSSLSKVSK